MPPVLLTAIGGLLIAMAMGRPLGAQDRTLVELGVTAVHFPADSVFTGGPSLRVSRVGERGRLSMLGSVSALAGDGGASGFAELATRWLGPSFLGWRTDGGAEMGALFATGARSSSAASNGVLSVRIQRAVGAGGMWLRGSGSVSRRAPDFLGGRGLDAGAWWRRQGVQIVASLAREWTEAQLFTGPGREGYAGTVAVVYSEGTLGLQVERDDATFAVQGTVRRDPGAESLVDRGVTATAVLWQAPTRAFVLSVASQLPDFVHGADAAQSLTIGIRLHEPSPRTARALRARPIVQVSGDSAARTVRVRAPGATRVEIMGDFSDWEPVELASAGDAFSVTLPMAAGVRRVVVRIDGGAWAPAANTPAVDDDFGGRVGLLLVP